MRGASCDVQVECFVLEMPGARREVQVECFVLEMPRARYKVYQYVQKKKKVLNAKTLTPNGNFFILLVLVPVLQYTFSVCYWTYRSCYFVV